MYLKSLCLTALLALGSLSAASQSLPLVQSYRDFETAKAAAKVPEALAAADRALELTAAGGDSAALIELLRTVGDYAASVDRDSTAAAYYERALALEERALGEAHPDLVALLTRLADLDVKDRRYADAGRREQRILAIERESFGATHPNVHATLVRLRDVYERADDAGGVARIDAELHPPPAATRGGLPLPGAAVTRNRRYDQSLGFATVRVFYGTNRAPTGDPKPAEFYGKARGDLQYGYVDVTIPAAHREAELETQPRWTDYVLEASAARRRYVLLDKIVPLVKQPFIEALRHDIQAAPSKDVFVFVHGFNNTFEDSARRAAQLVYDLDFDGTPVLYSWPSEGSTTAYSVDEATVGISGRKMADFLDTLVTQSGATRIHILAHSMGNRALIEALLTLLAKRTPDARHHLFGQLVFTAPDVDRDYFIDAVGDIAESADRVTLYASDNDYALRSSQLLHGAPRAGTAGDVIIRQRGLDSIDMSAVPADMLGHSYFAANAGAIFDIFRLLWRGDPPTRRCGMNGNTATGAVPIWIFDADACKGDAMLTAGLMLKRFGAVARERVIAHIAALSDPGERGEWSTILGRLDTLISKDAAP